MIDIIDQLRQRISGLLGGHAFGVAVAFASKVSGAGFAFLFSVLLARLLGTAGTGIYFLALTIVSIGATVARLGLDNAVLRFASISHDQGDRATLAALYRQSFGLIIVAGGIVALIIWFAVPYLPLGGSQLQVVLPVMLVALIPSSLILLQGGFFKSIGLPGTALFVQTAMLPMFLLIGGGIFWWRGDVSVHDIALLYAIAAILSISLAAFIWRYYNPGLWQEPGLFDTRLLLRTSLPLLLVASMNLVMGWTDILVLGVWTDPATVGIYGVATRIAALTSFILVAVNSVTAPRFAALYAKGEHHALEQIARRSAAGMLLAASPVIVVLLLFPEWLLQLFGADFVEGTLLLRILALGQLVNVAMGSVGYLLMMTGHERLLRNNIMFSALLNLVGNLVLVPGFGGMGAAVSTAFSIALMNIISFILVYKKLRINTLGYFFRGRKV